MHYLPSIYFSPPHRNLWQYLFMDNTGAALMIEYLDMALVLLFSVNCIFFVVRVGGAVYNRITDRED